VSSFDEGIGLLANAHGREAIAKHLRVENIDPGDRNLRANLPRVRIPPSPLIFPIHFSRSRCHRIVAAHRLRKIQKSNRFAKRAGR